MAKSKPISRPATRKGFPLSWHAHRGKWFKKVDGKFHYFGTKGGDPVEAEREYDAFLRKRHYGDDPEREVVTVEHSINQFLEAKHQQCERGELTKRSFVDYQKALKQFADKIGRSRFLESIRATDLTEYRDSLPRHWSPATTNLHLRQVRAWARWVNAAELTEKPLVYELGTKQVSRKQQRKKAAERPAKEFTRREVHRLLKAADATGQPHLRAIILLGINAAYGSADIGRLKIADIDFGSNWLGSLRGKTGIARGCWLWPETVEALRIAIDARPDTRNPRLDELALLTRSRRPWFEDGIDNNALQQAFNKLKKNAGIEKRGVGHYALRHVFRTVASSARDVEATRFVMGHDDGRIDGQYIEGIDPSRVRAVCEHVRRWLFDLVWQSVRMPIPADVQRAQIGLLA